MTQHAELPLAMWATRTLRSALVRCASGATRPADSWETLQSQCLAVVRDAGPEGVPLALFWMRFRRRHAVHAKYKGQGENAYSPARSALTLIGRRPGKNRKFTLEHQLIVSPTRPDRSLKRLFESRGMTLRGYLASIPSVAIVDGRVTLQSSPAESSSNGPGSRDGPTDPADDEVDTDGVRINKRLGEVLSRREADRALIAGCVHVNGAVAESGQRVGPADEVRLDGELVRWQPADPTT